MSIGDIVIGLMGWAVGGLASWISYRFYRKAVVYDTVFQYLADDIYTNLLQFARLRKMNVMMDEPEIQQAHRNMAIMGRRLEEILRRMEEATGLRLRPPPSPPPPKVV